MQLDFLLKGVDHASSRFCQFRPVTGMLSAAAALIDQAQLATLAVEVGPALADIMQTFRAEVRDRIITMRRHLQGENRLALSAEAHSIKGTASAMGLLRLSQDAGLLEYGAKTMSGEEMAVHLRSIQRSFYESCSALAELGHLPPLTEG
jgi:HPt (histidine-containing phosphotransfer) domain-containing protein